MEELENKSKKQGKGSIIVIILLILIILGLAGYICYDKQILFKTTTSNSETEVKASEKEVDYDETLAKKLVDKYYAEFFGADVFTYENGFDGLVKDAIAVNNIASSKRQIGNCYGFYLNNTAAKQEGNNFYVTLNPTEFELKYKTGACIEGRADYYNYDDLNSVYKDLFGKSNNMPKSDFSIGGMVYDYLENENIFVSLSCECGGTSGPHYKNYFVQSAKKKKDTLTVNIGYIFLTTASGDNSDDPMLVATIDGKEVSYRFSDTLKDTFEQEFKDKYLDKLDTYQFTFKYEDDHYIFVSMTKK